MGGNKKKVRRKAGVRPIQILFSYDLRWHEKGKLFSSCGKGQRVTDQLTGEEIYLRIDDHPENLVIRVREDQWTVFCTVSGKFRSVDYQKGDAWLEAAVAIYVTKRCL